VPFPIQEESNPLLPHSEGQSGFALAANAIKSGKSLSSMNSPGTSVSMGRVLLVCDDSTAIQQLADGMQKFAIATEVCATVSLAVGLVNRKKFEAIIIDSGMMQAHEMLGQVRLSPSNRTAVTFAITDPAKPGSFEVQPNFLIEKPLSVSSVGRTLKAAFGLIVRERRRSFRCPIEISAAIRVSGEEGRCQLVNISEGGMAISRSPLLKPGMHVRVLFTLPDQLMSFKIEAVVCWYDAQARAGLRSLIIPSQQKSVLQQWLSDKLEEDLPESVARLFRKG
jgi:CheY-like chemotaxis protein